MMELPFLSIEGNEDALRRFRSPSDTACRLPVHMEELQKARGLYLAGDIDPKSFDLQAHIMLINREDRDKPVEEREPIRLYICSLGGTPEIAWSLTDTVLQSVTPVWTVNTGVCNDEAALVFLAGSRRFMTPHASVTIGSGMTTMAGTAAKVMDATEQYKRGLRQLQSYITERAGITAAQLNRNKGRSWELDAQTCLENGVCHMVTSLLDDIL